MSNFHLKDKRLSLKAKGLLSQILSLPEDWDYTLSGLAHINIEHRETIGKAVKELIDAGYIIRSQERSASGKLGKSSYVIYENPHENPRFMQETSEIQPQSEKPSTVNPCTEKPTTAKPCTEKPSAVKPRTVNSAQLKTNIPITQKSKTDALNHSFKPTAENERMNDKSAPKSYRDYYKRIKANIDYDVTTDPDYGMIRESDKERIDEIVDVMVDMLFPEKPTVRIGGSDFPHDVVKSRLFKITADHVLYILRCMDNNTTKITNMTAYLRKVIYNAPTTHSNHMSADVNNHLYGEKHG
jgi:hypothetical protein